MSQGELSCLSSVPSKHSAHPTRGPHSVLLRGVWTAEPRLVPPLLLICCVTLASRGLCLGPGKYRAGLASQREPPTLTPLSPCLAVIRPAPVCAPAAVLGDDGDHPNPPSRLSHPVQLRGVCGAVPSPAARREAGLQAGTELGASAGGRAGGLVPALGWAKAPLFSLEQCAGRDITSATSGMAGKIGVRQWSASESFHRHAWLVWT